jgi:uncharacterized protein (DUF433 family)
MPAPTMWIGVIMSGGLSTGLPIIHPLATALEFVEPLYEYIAMKHPLISIDPEILAGKPAIKGTRLGVEFIIGLMAEGISEAELLASYPGLTREHVLACLAFARDALEFERVVPTAA